MLFLCPAACWIILYQGKNLYFSITESCLFEFFKRNGFMWSNLQGILYASVGFACGLVGQGIANLIMTAKRYG